MKYKNNFRTNLGIIKLFYFHILMKPIYENKHLYELVKSQNFNMLDNDWYKYIEIELKPLYIKLFGSHGAMHKAMQNTFRSDILFFNDLLRTRIHYNISRTNATFLYLVYDSYFEYHRNFFSIQNIYLPLLSILKYDKMREQMKPLAEELIEKVFHPLRLCRICDKFNLDLEEYLQLI
jgi:hypothetical protein